MATRKGSQIGVWIIVGLLVIGLGGWYTGGAVGRASSVATVDGLEMDVQIYANALRNRMREIEAQTGQPLTFAEAQSLGVDRDVLARLLTDRTLDAEARRLGLSVGDARVARAVTGLGAFQGLDGQFDRQLYREQLRRNGLDEEAFETSLREDTTRTLLQAAVASGLPQPDTYADALSSFANERRTVTWTALDTAFIAVAPRPTEEDLRAFHEANPDRFTSPEIRQVSYAWITPEMIQDSLPVDDQAVRDLYDARLSEFVQEERRLVERLVFPSDEAAEAARARLDAGEAGFEDLVEERGLLLSDTDLGDVTRGELDDAGEAVFATEPGQVAGPLPTSLGPALFRVNAVLAADETTFEEAAPDLRAELASDQARRVIADLVPQVEDLVAGGAGIADIAERTDLEPGEIALAEGVTEGPVAYQEVREAVQAAEVGDLPALVELSDGGLAALSLDAVTPPVLRSFEEARADVESAWAAQALRQAVVARAQAAAEAIAAGGSFEDQGLAPRTEEGLTRRSTVEGTSPDFLPAAFAMQPGEARAVPTGDGALILRLDAVEPAPEDDPAVLAERVSMASELSGAISQDVFEAFARALQVNTEIRIDDRSLAAVQAQFD